MIIGASIILKHDGGLLIETPDGWETRHGRGRYRAWSRSELEATAMEAGFVEPIWHGSPETSDFNATLTAISP